MLTTLRQRDFALVWWGGLISLTGDRVFRTALPFYIYAQTGSTLADEICEPAVWDELCRDGDAHNTDV